MPDPEKRGMKERMTWVMLAFVDVMLHCACAYAIGSNRRRNDLCYAAICFVLVFTETWKRMLKTRLDRTSSDSNTLSLAFLIVRLTEYTFYLPLFSAAHSNLHPLFYDEIAASRFLDVSLGWFACQSILSMSIVYFLIGGKFVLRERKGEDCSFFFCAKAYVENPPV